MERIPQNVINLAVNKLHFIMRNAAKRRVILRLILSPARTGREPENHIRRQTFMLTLKSFIERHRFLYENRCFECKHRAQRARPAVRRNITQYVSNINTRIVDAQYKYLYFMTLHTRDARARTHAFNFSKVIFARASDINRGPNNVSAGRYLARRVLSSAVSQL